MTENYENWDAPAPLPDMDAELKKMQKSLRRRNRKIVLTSVILVIAILIGTIEVGIPALERQYWDPTQCTYLEGITDLELTMVTYNELFGHGKHLVSVDVQKRGFADYTMNTIFADWETANRMTKISHRSASVTKGELTCPPNFWMDGDMGMFARNLDSRNPYYASMNQRSRETLNTLPEYVQVHASITFSEDLSMDQLLELTRQYLGDHSQFIWALLRNTSENDYYGQCGVLLPDYQSSRYSPSYWEETAYPCLFADRYNWSGSDMEQHIISMLQFSADQVAQGTGITLGGDGASYYLDTLAYMEENGIKTYGVYIIASPQVLLELMNNGTAAYLRLLDAQIAI